MNHDDHEEVVETTDAGDANLNEWQDLMLDWLNNPPERSRPSVVIPKPPYFDRTVMDRERFMERARPKITKDVIKNIIRGKGDLFQNILVGAPGGTVYVPGRASTMGSRGFYAGDIEVPIGIEEPSWSPGRDNSGGGGGSGQGRGEDDADLVYMPISYEEFLELMQMLFDLPFLRQTDADRLMMHKMKIRGVKKSGPMARWDKRATAVARLERFIATYNAHPEEFPGFSPDSPPSVEEFPFHKMDLRFRRVEEIWDPDSKAVVFFELDISGSMGGEPLAIAKFFFLLNLIWLKTRYKEVTVVYIPHNGDAKRVRTEQEFFRLDVSGGTSFAPAHELVWNIANAEFGPAYSWYCLHATDGFGEPAQYITPWIEKMIRGGFSYFGYLEINGGWFGGWTSSGMEAVLAVAEDVKQAVGYAKVSTLDEVPDAMKQIMTKDKTAAN